MERQLTVPGRYDRLAEICAFVDQAAQAAGLDDTTSSRCQLAVDEACTNVIEHGYGGEDKGTLEISCDARPGELTITVRDRGREFDPTRAPDPKLDAAVEDMGIGGLGIYFMRQVMDSIDFQRRNGVNTLVMIKRGNS
jgi:anti-sigma regulatory factor (Ser/Thr protein kinase)